MTWQLSNTVSRPERSARLAASIACICAMAVAQGARAQSENGTVLEEIIVTGSQVDLAGAYAGGQIARGGRVGMFGNLDIMDTPFNSTNYTAELMRDLQARSVADVVTSDPAVRVARGFGNFQELYVVRGFPVYSDDMSYNGLYGLLPRQFVAAEFLERVEVFRGANTFLNGAAPGGSGVGGNFNLVPKRAPDGGLNRLTAGWENASALYLAGDIARRFGTDEAFGVRANGVWRDGETSVDNQDRQLKMLSLGVDYRGEVARFSADFGYQDHNIDAPRPSVTPFGGIPSPPDASSNFAQPWTFSSEKDTFGVARGEWDVTDSVRIWAATGFRDSKEHNVLSNPTSDATGATTAYRFDNYREDLVTTSEIGVRAEFMTGSVGHRVSLSGSIFKLDSKNAYAFSSFFTPFAGNLYEPFDVPPPAADFFTGGVLFDPKTTSKPETSSIALADMLAFADERFLLTLGARLQSIKNTSYDYNTGEKISGYDEDEVTPVVGIVYKPSEKISLYANYIEGLIPGDTAPVQVAGVPVSNAGEVFKPFASEQYEIGAKYDAGQFGGALALFQLTKPSLRLDGTVVRDSGEEEHRGAELTFYGEPVTGLRLLGGLTYLRAENKKTLDGSYDGKDVIGVPKTQANLGVDWTLGETGLSFDGRVIYTSSQPADLANTLEIDSWTRLDLGARYTVLWGDTEMTIRARIDNVTDKDYWASTGGSFNANYLVLGAPRTFTVSASFDF
jgi:iron complex outermembrane recepter protein